MRSMRPLPSRLLWGGLALLIAAGLTSCFNPEYPDQAFACNAADPDPCPAGFSCVGGRCRRGGGGDAGVLEPRLTCGSPRDVGKTKALLRPVDITVDEQQRPVVFFVTQTGEAKYSIVGDSGKPGQPRTVGGALTNDCAQISATVTTGDVAHVVVARKATTKLYDVYHTATPSLDSPQWSAWKQVAPTIGGKPSIDASTVEITSSGASVVLTAPYRIGHSSVQSGTAVAAMRVAGSGGSYSYPMLCRATRPKTTGEAFAASRIAISGDDIVLTSSATRGTQGYWTYYYVKSGASGGECTAAATLNHNLANLLALPEAMAATIDNSDVGLAYGRGGAGFPDVLRYGEARIGGGVDGWEDVAEPGKKVKVGSPDLAFHTHQGQELSVLSYIDEDGQVYVTIGTPVDWYRTAVAGGIGKDYTRLAASGDTIHVTYDHKDSALASQAKYFSCELSFE